MNKTVNEKCIYLLDKLYELHSLSTDEYAFLLDNQSDEIVQYARHMAEAVRRAVYGEAVYIRGLIEISNFCKNDCYYCGIRRSNASCERYRLSKEDILDCCQSGYKLGFRTFVLQGGEDSYFNDKRVCDIVAAIKKAYPDCAVTLSLGEKKKESFEAFFAAGADRYLLRHETANSSHYSMLHPKEQALESRMKCLYDLKQIGYQVGCGFMVGSPYQTNGIIAEDLKFIEKFKPDMCGIGPFIPHHATPFADFPSGSVEKTIFLLSIIRLIRPNILLPATTALATADDMGREKGILAGANVIMPNLSPVCQRAKYELYDNKLCTGDEAAESLAALKNRIEKIGYKIVTSRGDVILERK